mmetsp:Transcript_17406/g.40175  ORF Transcript_17406/g.40175 Transcript_17406/m.40175 type:complete len:234 (-) Transcript_17406:106-807(-)
MVLFHPALQARASSGAPRTLVGAGQAGHGRNRRLRRGHASCGQVPRAAGVPSPRQCHWGRQGRHDNPTAPARPQAPEGGSCGRCRRPGGGTHHDGPSAPASPERLRRGNPGSPHRRPAADAPSLQARLLRSGLRARPRYARQHGPAQGIPVPAHSGARLGRNQRRRGGGKHRGWHRSLRVAQGRKQITAGKKTNERTNGPRPRRLTPSARSCIPVDGVATLAWQHKFSRGRMR